MSTRKPAVAGRFYPSNSTELDVLVGEYLNSATSQSYLAKAIISPHAGFMYSGAIAASAYKAIAGQAKKISRVILLGPSHHVAYTGLALPSDSRFTTPLGSIDIDTHSCHHLNEIPFVNVNDNAHLWEHSLEVQLPFLQKVLDDFSLVPLVVGQASKEEIAEVLQYFWDDSHTLVVVSSDLSHYHPYDEAVKIDQHTTHLIEEKTPELTGDRACGYRGINGLLKKARASGLSVTTLDLRNSGDTAGNKEQVVGYGAYVIH